MCPDNVPEADGERLRRAKERTLTRAELDEVAAQLSAEQSPTRRYKLLLTLGRGGDAHYRDVVDALLRANDPEISRLALDILIRYWRLGPDYIETLLSFMAGVPWDNFGSVRSAAIGNAGAFLAEQTDPRLLARLIELSTDRSAPDEERAAAIFALGKSLHDPWAMHSGFSTDILAETGLVDSVLARARSSLGT